HGLDQVLGEAGELVGGELLEPTQVDHQVDRLVVGPDVGAAVDAGLQDREVWGGALGHRDAPSCSAMSPAAGGSAGGSVGTVLRGVRLRARRRRRVAGERSPAAMLRAICWRS